MKPSTDDKATGTLHEVKGAIKQKAGELTNDPDLAANGEIEKNGGKVQHFVGKVEKAVGEQATDVTPAQQRAIPKPAEDAS